MRLVALMASCTLAACSIGSDTPGEAAERNIASDLQELFDTIDVAPAADCVRANATETEIAILSQDNIATTPLTRQIFERDTTLACLQANGVIEVIDIVEVVQ